MAKMETSVAVRPGRPAPTSSNGGQAVITTSGVPRGRWPANLLCKLAPTHPHKPFDIAIMDAFARLRPRGGAMWRLTVTSKGGLFLFPTISKNPTRSNPQTVKKAQLPPARG
jgi:hypothetical protein